MSIQNTLDIIRAMGMNVTWNADTREYRVTFPAWEIRDVKTREAFAYYTNDGQDAIKSARSIREQRDHYNMGLNRKPVASCGEFQGWNDYAG